MSAQDRMDCIVYQITSFLPPPLVPAPEADDSDDDHFSFTSSDSEDDDRSAAFQSGGDGRDHTSRLPRILLSNVISRLPTKEAARTMVLSTSWRGVWAATPLLVDDAHSRLEVLGVLDLQLHTLEIGGTVIRVGMTMKDSVTLPSLKILAVKVRFSHDKEVKMLHTLLRCFPCLETLHIMSIRSSSPDSGDCAETWNSLGSADCLSHLKKFVLHGFHGLDREQLFVSYILEKGIKTLGIVYGDNDDVLVKGGLVPGSVGEANAPSGGSSSSDSDDVVMEADPISCSVGEGNVPSGVNSGSGIYVCPASPCWTLQHAIDLSVEDPFCVLRHDKARIASFADAMRLCASLGC